MGVITGILSEAGVSKEKCEKFETFAEMLTEANRSFNLTRITDEMSMATMHFLDSISPALSGLIDTGVKVIDVGAGGGFPCVPLAIFREDISVTALEASEKKLKFIEQVSIELGLKITCVCARAEEYAFTDARETFDICVSRAVAKLNILLELASPLVRPGGKVLCYKGDKCAEEIELASGASKTLMLSEPVLYRSKVKNTAHVIVEYKKIGRLLRIYPRRFSKIKSSPL